MVPNVAPLYAAWLETPAPNELAEFASSETHVRICPHQALPFCHLHRIANLPNIKNAEPLDAFQYPHRHPLLPPYAAQCTSRECYAHCKEFGVHFFATSTIEFESDDNANRSKGFVLHVNWSVHLITLLFKHMKSRDGIRKTMERSKVQICPHARLCDEWFVDATFDVLHIPRGSGANGKGYQIFECDECDTRVQMGLSKAFNGPIVEFGVRRWLGTGIEEEDKTWLRQCEPV